MNKLYQPCFLFQVEPKLAVSKSSDRKSTSTEGVKKVFIGGIPLEADEDTIRSTFKHHGDVVAVDLKYDKSTNRMRGTVMHSLYLLRRPSFTLVYYNRN